MKRCQIVGALTDTVLLSCRECLVLCIRHCHKSVYNRTGFPGFGLEFLGRDFSLILTLLLS